MLDIFDGKFITGTNYWASDVGIKMWENFNEETIKNDLEILSKNGIKLLRVFPTWSFFQPIEEMVGYQGYVRGITTDGGETLLFDIDESAGINPIAIERFEKFLNIAEEHEIKIIPSLITGWMSESIFAPRALQNKNLITDPFALKWEVRFCRYFVKYFYKHKIIIAWDLGNECNCMGRVNNPSEAWLWTATISNAIRSVDSTRPVISGMHSLGLKGEKSWTYYDQAENCDILTTHSYASPENKTDLVPGDSFKAVLMPAIETKIYRDISRKPCFIEEAGTYGEMYMDEETTAVYSYNSIINTWAHGCNAYLWWLGFDQGELRYIPYGYNNRASNYGLFKSDYKPKKILDKIKKFNRFLADFKYKTLPPAIVDGVCIFTPNTSSVAMGSTVFNLAQQAGINLNFAYVTDTIPEAPLYIMPSIKSNSIGVNALDSLMRKVENGAVLYVSASTGILRNFVKDFGIRIVEMIEFQNNYDKCVFSHNTEEFQLDMPLSKKTKIDLVGAKAIAWTSDGYPVFMQCDYGKGKLFLLLSGFEEWLFNQPYAFEKGYHKIYSIIVKSIDKKQKLYSDNDFVTVTEHLLENGNRIVVAVNNQSKDIETFLGKADLKLVHYGTVYSKNNEIYALLDANDMVVFEIWGEKNERFTK